MSLIQDYEQAHKAWKKMEPKPLELKFPCLDKGWEDGWIVFRIDIDGIGVRDFYRFKRELGGEMEAVSSSKRGRMTVINWKSKGLEARYIFRFTRWIDDILGKLKDVQYALKYKAWMNERPKDLIVHFRNKAGHKVSVEYFDGGVFYAQDYTEWHQVGCGRKRAFQAFLAGRKEDEYLAETVNGDEAIQKIQKWLDKISA